MTSEKAEGPAADRTPSATSNANQAAGYPSLGHEGHMRLLADRIAWLERHEHWWARQLRWEREVEAA